MHRSLFVAMAAVLALVVSACGGGGGGSSGGGSGGASSSSSSSALAVTIHYKRIAGDYTGWGLHLWNDTTGTPAIAAATVTTWASPHAFDGVTGGWATAVIPLANDNANLNFVVHMGDAKSPMLDLKVNPSTFGHDVWVIQDTAALYATQATGDAAALKVGHQADALDLRAVTVASTASALPARWNERAQFMEIFVRSYKDSNGDGKGDLKGLTGQLDYLKSLGVTGLWLMPVYQSQDHDHGYAVTDYRSIESDYGTLADFDDLVTQAHARGIGIVLDYVMNHSAAQNPLFLDAVSATGNSRRTWYEFQASNPGWTGLGGGQSFRVAESGWYYGLFSPDMPDFNLQNPDVIAYHMDNLRFWLNRGVDGFRFDAAETFVETGAGAWYNQPQNHPILLLAKTVINGYSNRYMVCEAPDHPSDYAATTSCGHAFAFGVNGDVRSTAAGGTLASGLAAYLTAADRPRRPLFLSNHDSFAGSRPIGELSGHAEGDYRTAAAIEVLTSDTPFAYYGEEIGMAGNGESGDGGVRSPMSWSGAANAGFSTVTPYRGLSTNYATHNVLAQDGVPGSLHDWYRSLYGVRSAWPVLQSGALTLLSAPGDSHLVFLRTLGGQRAVVVINLQSTTQSITVDTGLNATFFGDIYPTIGGSHTSTASGKITVSVPTQGVLIFATP